MSFVKGFQHRARNDAFEKKESTKGGLVCDKLDFEAESFVSELEYAFVSKVYASKEKTIIFRIHKTRISREKRSLKRSGIVRLQA